MMGGKLGHTAGSVYEYSPPSVSCRNFKYSETCLQRNHKGPDFFRPIISRCLLIRVLDIN